MTAEALNDIFAPDEKENVMLLRSMWTASCIFRLGGEGGREGGRQGGRKGGADGCVCGVEKGRQEVHGRILFFPFRPCDLSSLLCLSLSSFARMHVYIHLSIYAYIIYSHPKSVVYLPAV
jgi:hypothetical protein